jgi:hypothetical protein
MNAITGCWVPASKLYGTWAFRTIHHGAGRSDIAEKARIIKLAHGRNEAREFLTYLHWLGTYPVTGSCRWNHKYKTGV